MFCCDSLFCLHGHWSRITPSSVNVSFQNVLKIFLKFRYAHLHCFHQHGTTISHVYQLYAQRHDCVVLCRRALDATRFTSDVYNRVMCGPLFPPLLPFSAHREGEGVGGMMVVELIHCTPNNTALASCSRLGCYTEPDAHCTGPLRMQSTHTNIPTSDKNAVSASIFH